MLDIFRISYYCPNINTSIILQKGLIIDKRFAYAFSIEKTQSFVDLLCIISIYAFMLSSAFSIVAHDCKQRTNQTCHQKRSKMIVKLFKGTRPIAISRCPDRKIDNRVFLYIFDIRAEWHWSSINTDSITGGAKCGQAPLRPVAHMREPKNGPIALCTPVH